MLFIDLFFLFLNVYVNILIHPGHHSVRRLKREASGLH